MATENDIAAPRDRRPLVGALVVGQSPRPEVEAELRRILGPGAALDLRGALDGLSRDEIGRLAPEADADALFTRLPSGEAVRLSKAAVIRLGTARLAALEVAGCAAVVVLCTGAFSEWETRFRVLFPSRILPAVVRAAVPSGRLAVFAPLPEQVAETERRWATPDHRVTAVALSPDATDAEAMAAAEALPDVDLLVLDCISYLDRTRRLMARAAGRPAVLALSAAARVAAELAGA